ncbi:hypothetical protein B9Z19DRAFT_1119615 [Tuber borchii]|uniref:Uncharacterized protein n=1 Tax=Tuber borchii TaxID=42251 RepID=A0A2T7A629_TUBBO|nr:hypothetical protein B9Z19DRAFT_1119615 [Tuber borchii]
MRTYEELLPRTLLPRVPLGSAGSLPPLTSPDYLPVEEYSRPLTTTFFSLGVVLCTVLFLALIICCAARLAGRIHEHRRVRMRDRQGLTSGRRMMMMRRLEVLRKGEVLGQETVIKIGTVVVAAEEEEGKGGKRDNIDENGGCDDGKKSGEDLEKGGGGGGGGGGGEEEGGRGGGRSEWDVSGYGEPPKYDAVGFNEKGEMIDAPCSLYPPGVKSMTNGLGMGVCW